jgi:hypothetical protein
MPLRPVCSHRLICAIRCLACLGLVVCFVLIFVWTRTSTASGVNLLVSPENRSAGSTCEQCNQLQRREAPSRPFPTRTEPARARRASPKLRRDRIRAQNLDDNPHEALRTARAGISRWCHAYLCRSIRRSNGSALADGSQSCGLPREPIAFKSCHYARHEGRMRRLAQSRRRLRDKRCRQGAVAFASFNGF